jgi:phosphate transport system permease protein
MTTAFNHRKHVNNLMFIITGLFALISVTSLLTILGYIAYHGFSTVNGAFFTQLPKPLGETGGGIANSIVGSIKVVGVAALIGLPIGVFGAVYLAEYGGNRLGFYIRY